MNRDGNVTEIAAREIVTILVLQRLPLDLQNVALKLRKLVQQQYAVMSQGNFSRARRVHLQGRNMIQAN